LVFKLCKRGWELISVFYYKVVTAGELHAIFKWKQTKLYLAVSSKQQFDSCTYIPVLSYVLLLTH